ncbi:MAG: mechanosensitive ion channel protein MscS, partial [Synechococcaceae cyanobacterium]|nr:mechanosensitive ion channel protein MscS [Synechococcaceae cyanobacterium]
MIDLLHELQGWFAFLQRPSVLLQLGAITALAFALVQRSRLPRWPWLRWLRATPLSLLLLAGQGLIALLLSAAGLRVGLVLLGARICLAWFGLQLLETQLLVHTLPPQARHVLVSRLLRPAFLVVVL